MAKETKKQEWHEKLDAVGKRSWDPEKQRTSSYVAAIIVNIIILFLINYVVPFQNIPFIKDSIIVVIWFWNITLLATIAVNFFLIFFRSKPFVILTQFLLNAISLLGTIIFLVIFPVDFEKIGMYWLNTLFRIGLYISILAMSVMAVIFFVKFILSLIELEK